jgi:hypothetical protein
MPRYWRSWLRWRRETDIIHLSARRGLKSLNRQHARSLPSEYRIPSQPVGHLTSAKISHLADAAPRRL